MREHRIEKAHAYFCRSTIGRHKIRNNYTHKAKKTKIRKREKIDVLYLEIKMRSKYCIRIVKFAENIINFGGKEIYDIFY